MAALSLPFKPFARFRRSRPAPPRLLFPAYRHDNALRRNRKKLAIALFFFTLIYIMAFQLFGRFIVAQFVLPLVLLFFLIVWALPERGFPPFGPIKFFFFGFIAALLLWPDYLALALPGMPWITALRLTGLPLILIVGIFLSTSQQFRRQFQEILAPSRLLVRMIVALAALLAISIFFSDSIFFSLNRVFVMQVNLICIFFVSCYVFTKPGMAMRFVYLLLVAILFLAMLALWEIQKNEVPWADHIPWFFKIDDEIVAKILEGGMRSAIGVHRLQSKYTTPLSFAEFLALAAPFILHVAMTARKLWLRPVAWLTLPLMFWLIIKTDSRLGVVGFLMTMVLYVLAWASMRWHKDRGSLFGPAVTLAYPVIFSVVILATFFVGRVRNMVWGTGAHAASNNAREVQWEMAYPKILAQPWGYGTGKGGSTLGYTDLSGAITIDSYYISILLELGIVGFLIFYGAIILCAVTSARLAPKALGQEEQLLVPIAIALANFIIIKAVLSQQEGHPLVFVMMGMAVALTYRMKKRTGEPFVSRNAHAP